MRLLIVGIGIFLVFGCSSRVPLTKGLIRDYGLSSADIPKLQLYISDGILLEKHLTKVDKNIDSNSYGLIKVEDYYVKQIFFKRETPCIATSANADKLAVAFEWPGDRLNFYSTTKRGTSMFEYGPEKKAMHDTLEKRSSAAGFGNWRTIGEQTYSDTSYTVLVHHDFPYLLVDKTSLKNFTIDARKVRGLRQGESKK